ncbi:autophagy-related protein 17 [Syncephalastrum racemosum]|uniref:Autophagy-related protein 17 n=1 Tax=Syncephalastrum racemosum TaxID=13706 RepID=A0A1X2H262_SYNRA|nr:autophagy-related protein 17 [Syncephalastrum racemosum]
MEQELIELLLVAKKALSTGQAVCEQANQCSLESDHYAELIEKTWPRILFVHNHILVQLTTLDRIREFVAVKADEVRSCIDDRERALNKVSIELQTIFDVLRNSAIDKGILRINEQERRTTLFDYIDDQAVLELQRQADDEISDIEGLFSSLVTTAKSLSATISDLAAMQEAALSVSLNDSGSAFTNERAQIQEEEITKMAEILTSLTNHYDQLGEATRLCQSGPEAQDQLDITVLQNDHNRIPDILDELHESLEIVESVKEEIRVRVQVYASVQDDLIKVLDHLDHFGSPNGQADIICEKIISAEAEMKEHETSLTNLFKELSALKDWYRVYAASYNHLILEIERRKKTTEKQERLYQELVQSFEDTYNDELQERRRWFAQHGEYLPEDLCQFMMEQPSRLTVNLVSPDRVRLPDLSESTVQKALEGIHSSRADPVP